MAPDVLARNLLFGVLALKADAFDALGFTKFCSAWAARKEGTFADWLQQRGWISAPDRAAVDHLVTLKLRKHGEVAAALAAECDAAVTAPLTAVPDPEIQQALDGLLAWGESSPIHKTLVTPSDSQAPCSSKEPAASRPRPTRGLLRILVPAGIASVAVALACLAWEQRPLADANRRAEEARELASQREAQAQADLALAQETVDAFCNKLLEEPRLKEKNLEDWRRQVLQKAVASYEQFVAHGNSDPNLRAELAQTYCRLGKLTGLMGDSKEAISLYERAILVQEKLATEYPVRIGYQVELGGQRYELATRLQAAGQTERARSQFTQALEDLGGVFASDGRKLKARRYLALSHTGLGTLYSQEGKPEQAAEEFRQSAALEEKHVADHPQSVEDALQLSLAYANLGELKRRYGKPEEAVQWCRRSTQTLEAIQALAGDRDEFQVSLADQYFNLGVAYSTAKQLEPAEASWRKALAIGEGLAARHPEVVAYLSLVARSQNNLGVAYLRRSQLKEAEAAFRQALAANEKLSARNPDLPDNQMRLAFAQTNLGEVYSRLGLHEKAAECLRSAASIRQKLAADFPTNTQYQLDLASASVELGRLHVRTARLDDALAAYRQAEEAYEKSERRTEIAEAQYKLANHYKDLAMRYKAAANLEQTIAAYLRMLAVVEKLASGYPDRADYAVALGSSYYEFGFFLNEKGKPEQALAWYAKALGTLEALRQREPTNAEARTYLRNTHWARGRALVRLKRSREAIPDLDQAFDLDPGGSRNALWWEGRLTRARAGLHAQATSEVERRLREQKGQPAELVQAARIFAVAALIVREDVQLGTAEQEKRAEQFAARAVGFLQQIQRAGFLRNSAAVRQLKAEADLQGLQQREDYQRLLKSLDAANPE
jgi:tetratricopeptide (TPR) repeat protein